MPPSQQSSLSLPDREPKAGQSHCQVTQESRLRSTVLSLVGIQSQRGQEEALAPHVLQQAHGS